MFKHYYQNKNLKMGEWSLMPSDSENWHGEDTSKYFAKVFGFSKGSLVLHNIETGVQYSYFPESYFKKIYSYIDKTTKRDYKELEMKLSKFYNLKVKAKIEIPKVTVKDFKKISNKELVGLYKKNRNWAHKIATYDQFGWIAENYWNPVMADILTNRLGIKRDSQEYFDTLFTLTKPREISTTLEEKRDVILEVVRIKEKKQTEKKGAKKLTKKYGWMPVFTYGTPWNEEYYLKQIQEIKRKNIKVLKEEYLELKNYSKIQKEGIKKIVKIYNINKKDLQVFIDFSLALDTRNEAEYIISLAGFYLLPIYKEVARRLALTIRQLRAFFEQEIIDCMLDKKDSHEVLESKGSIVGWGFNKSMTKRINFSNREAVKLFKHLEKKVEYVPVSDVEGGICANSGKAIGRIKIVLSSEDNHKVKKGDILVTHATTVDYLPAMKRAAAFITEVGGLTCHAAVVSREFNVPCIVSLMGSTKKYKDGDKVEVDANNAKIKLIK